MATNSKIGEENKGNKTKKKNKKKTPMETSATAWATPLHRTPRRHDRSSLSRACTEAAASSTHADVRRRSAAPRANLAAPAAGRTAAWLPCTRATAPGAAAALPQPGRVLAPPLSRAPRRAAPMSAAVLLDVAPPPNGRPSPGHRLCAAAAASSCMAGDAIGGVNGKG